MQISHRQTRGACRRRVGEAWANPPPALSEPLLAHDAAWWERCAQLVHVNKAWRAAVAAWRASCTELMEHSTPRANAFGTRSVTPWSLPQVASFCPRLTRLELRLHASPSDDAWAALAQCSDLEALSVKHAGSFIEVLRNAEPLMSASGAALLGRGCSRLRELKLDGPPKSDSLIRALGQHWHSLERLEMRSLDALNLHELTSGCKAMHSMS
jgi:hypothetical protein